jgi:hypothetical protein
LALIVIFVHGAKIGSMLMEVFHKRSIIEEPCSDAQSTHPLADDPNRIREAEADLEELMRNMNEERARSGAEPVF